MGFFLKKCITIIIFLKKLFYSFIIYSRLSEGMFWGFFSNFLTDQNLLRVEVFLSALTTDRAKNSFLRICFSLGAPFLLQGTFVVSNPSNCYDDSFELFLAVEKNFIFLSFFVSVRIFAKWPGTLFAIMVTLRVLVFSVFSNYKKKTHFGVFLPRVLFFCPFFSVFGKKAKKVIFLENALISEKKV